MLFLLSTWIGYCSRTSVAGQFFIHLFVPWPLKGLCAQHSWSTVFTSSNKASTSTLSTPSSSKQNATYIQKLINLHIPTLKLEVACTSRTLETARTKQCKNKITIKRKTDHKDSNCTHKF